MKSSSNFQKRNRDSIRHRTPARHEKHQRTADTPIPQPVRAPVQRNSWWIAALLLLLVALGAGGGTWALFEFVVWNELPAELVGKWVVKEGPQEGATFDFYRNGTMVGHVDAGGKEAIVNARVRVEDKKIYSTTRNPYTGGDDTKVLVIRTLTARDLVVKDEQGKLMKMERAE
jgi:uncharacterized protein (TIGR03066 family)